MTTETTETIDKIKLDREGDIATLATFGAMELDFSVSFNPKAKLPWTCGDLAVKSMAELNAALATRGLRVRFVGGGSGPKTLELLAEGGATLPFKQKAEAEPEPAKKKKGGRPKKVAATFDPRPDQPAFPAEKKKRGRPRKEKAE